MMQDPTNIKNKLLLRNKYEAVNAVREKYRCYCEYHIKHITALFRSNRKILILTELI